MTYEVHADTLIVCGNTLIACAARRALRPSSRVHLGPFAAWLGRCGQHRVLVVASGDAEGTCYNATMLGTELSHARRVIAVHPCHASSEGLSPGDLAIAETICGIPTDNVVTARICADMTAHLPLSAIQPNFHRVASEQIQLSPGSCGVVKCARNRGMLVAPLLLVTSTAAGGGQAEFAANRKRIATFVSDAIRQAINSLP